MTYGHYLYNAVEKHRTGLSAWSANVCRQLPQTAVAKFNAALGILLNLKAQFRP
jgi:hypothetical protein